MKHVAYTTGDYTMEQIYIDALDELNAALQPSNLTARKIMPITSHDRWSMFLTTGKERDIEGQKGQIIFCRRISDELELEFSIYFPRFEYAVSQRKTFYVMSKGKMVFDGISNRHRDESPVGWILTEEERDVFTKWYTGVCQSGA